jgi:hypothetical protein
MVQRACGRTSRRSSIRRYCRGIAIGWPMLLVTRDRRLSSPGCGSGRARPACGISGQPDRLNNRDYAPIAEITGRLPWASEVFNGQAPDVPNMIMLQHAATPAQKQRWLEPLLDGRIRSAFGMTEPDVASADATNIATSLRRDGGDWVVNGRQVVHHRRRPSRLRLRHRHGGVASRGIAHRPAFCVIVPMDAPGLKVVRELASSAGRTASRPSPSLSFATCGCRSKTCWAKRARASLPRKCGWGRRGCITACGPSGPARCWSS